MKVIASEQRLCQIYDALLIAGALLWVLMLVTKNSFLFFSAIFSLLCAVLLRPFSPSYAKRLHSRQGARTHMLLRIRKLAVELFEVFVS